MNSSFFIAGRVVIFCGNVFKENSVGILYRLKLIIRRIGDADLLFDSEYKEAFIPIYLQDLPRLLLDSYNEIEILVNRYNVELDKAQKVAMDGDEHTPINVEFVHDGIAVEVSDEEENNEDQQLQPEEFVNEMDEEEDENSEMEEEEEDEEEDDKEFKKIDYNENNFICID